ncbi:hypothetical protein WOLCODRAFT_141248 [Wolfiporia cocos MD-104 SS10]|uniref:Uncharacterized protein n=1 Tax=Wolfiporia cocos (strain MD-104) TaxID=742152 RepID=A0A2H3JAW7_WOLCO|nr:hypothetical protein WOLCODRAFT_141248 [Wolfiporia cocos MD-104 SS10]
MPTSTPAPRTMLRSHEPSGSSSISDAFYALEDPGGSGVEEPASSPGTVTLTARQFTQLLSLIQLSPNSSLVPELAVPPSPISPRRPVQKMRSTSSPLLHTSVTAPSFPTFNAGPIPRAGECVLGKSLLESFPHVQAEVLLNIARHTFEPRDLCKLDMHFSDRVPRTCPSNPSPTSYEFITHFYPSFSSLFVPLSTYFRILLAHAASSGNIDATYNLASASDEYLAHLVCLHEEYHWSVVLQYHMRFHAARMQEMCRGEYTGWAHADLPLLMQILDENE